MISKPRPKLLEKRERKADTAAIDIAENKIVKARSGGRCEVITRYDYHVIAGRDGGVRCARRASQIHHLKSGIGRRNVGDSITARCKLHVCDFHHQEIHGHVLKPLNDAERYDAKTVMYERVR